MTSEWMFALATACQRFICESETAALAEVRSIAAATLWPIPDPNSPIASAVLRATLLELAVRWGYDRHTRLAECCVRTPCVPQLLADVARFWSVAGRSPIAHFEEWVGQYCNELARSHPESLARRVARLIDHQPQSPLCLTALAKIVGAHPSSIRRAFRKEFRTSLREYHTRTRVQLAEHFLRTSDAKVESVSVAVGWQSKKDMYRAFQHVRGSTPGQVRRRRGAPPSPDDMSQI